MDAIYTRVISYWTEYLSFVLYNQTGKAGVLFDFKTEEFMYSSNDENNVDKDMDYYTYSHK